MRRALKDGCTLRSHLIERVVMPNFTRTFSALCAAFALAGCKTVAGALGFVPVELVDGGGPAQVVPSGLGIEEAVGISGGASLIAAVCLNIFRNHTRAKMAAAAAEAGRFVSSPLVSGQKEAPTA